MLYISWILAKTCFKASYLICLDNVFEDLNKIPRTLDQMLINLTDKLWHFCRNMFKHRRSTVKSEGPYTHIHSQRLSLENEGVREERGGVKTWAMYYIKPAKFCTNPTPLAIFIHISHTPSFLHANLSWNFHLRAVSVLQEVFSPPFTPLLFHSRQLNLTRFASSFLPSFLLGLSSSS